MSRIAVEYAEGVEGPDAERVRSWAEAALGDRVDAELCIRIVDEAEGRELNHRYRQRDRATNVLSFPAELPEGVDVPLLGDIVICAPVVRREAVEQDRQQDAHWAHMVVHGVLHLLGMDHQEDAEAAAMESLESATMRGLGYPDPYTEDAPAPSAAG